ncbi:Farnesyl diphosphate synthase [Maioricimonas rarisocia]|uniref:Farnesyl diphosphate synthase n=1 Tax=Maioricimonas rarisocia TaxID=2528026 RepID=A0A517ZD68_9PLAN|nr:farnesyl diphosphate synthase [Maioricimonas rarisocia]QDU40436.1 Farnesyl diphosphate synthase [Maioricimonas rarisocia]
MNPAVPESTNTSLDEFLPAMRERVETALQSCLKLSDDCPPRLLEGIGYSLLGGGKRLRPVLTLMACEACGGDTSAAMPAACAVEMIHAYSLIHDDLPAMDDDEWRRGKPSNHIAFGEANAILAGDALLTLAFETIAGGIQPPEVAAACCLDLARAAGAEGMVGGQVADLEAEETPVGTVEQLEAIHRRKTGRLLCAALTLGGRVALADSQSLRSLQVYGENVGLAFQIADDLLDVVGTAETMGKGARKDASLGKLTYPSLLGEAESRRRAGALIDQARQALAPFGAKGRHLDALARYVIERDR